MSIKILEQYYAAFNERRFDDMLNFLSDDIVHDINQGESQQGKEAFGRFLKHMERCYRETLYHITLMATPDGSRGAAEFVVQGTYIATDEGLPQATNQRYSLPAGAFFSFADGKITRITMYYNLELWLRLIGA